MPKETPSHPFNPVRRSDRAVEDETWIRRQLHESAVGVLAIAADNRPSVHTNLFVYDEMADVVYLHTARRGHTRETIAANPDVCFSVHAMGRLLPADVALEFSVEYASVVLYGRASIVDDEREATRALQALLDKYFPHLTAGHDYRPPIPDELKRTTVIRIDIERWSGKQKAVDEDFPGAFWYGQPPI